MTVRRCGVCGRFRRYEADDRHCLVCGSDSLEASCRCGRDFGYALDETGDLHCPRCGRPFRSPTIELE